MLGMAVARIIVQILRLSRCGDYAPKSAINQICFSSTIVLATRYVRIL